MPMHILDVEPVDVTPDALTLTVGGTAPRALADVTLTHPRGRSRITLAVLGSSHAVTITGAGPEADSPMRLTEEVSCRAGATHAIPLPCRRREGRYGIDAIVDRRGESAVRSLAASLRDAATGEIADDGSGTTTLCGVFPGDDAALTAIACEPRDDGWAWRTWHLYPETGAVVTTESEWTP